MRKNYYIYQYRNKDDEVIYVGLTERPVARRIKEHETEALQKETHHILYATVSSPSDMRIYEIYYINKYKPKFNKITKYEEIQGVTLPELDFVPYMAGRSIQTETATQSDCRIYNTLCQNGILNVKVNEPYSDSFKRSAEINISGSPVFKKKELKHMIETLVEALNDLSENERFVLLEESV